MGDNKIKKGKQKKTKEEAGIVERVIEIGSKVRKILPEKIIWPPKINLPKKLKKRHVLAIIGIIIAVVLLFKGISNIKNVLFGKKKAAEAAFDVVSEAPPVKVYKIKRMDFKDTLPVLGTIKGYKEIPLKFQTSGILESFNFEEGEKIQEGDIIANLEQRDALLKLKYAELEHTIAKKMFELGSTVEIALEKSQLEYEAARNDLEKTNIYAVADGVLGMQDIDVGTYITPSDKVGMFVDVSRVYAEFDVIEKDVPKLKLGQKSEIFVDALPNKNFVGTVDTISPVIEGRTRTQRIKVELKNIEGNLKPGMFTRGLVSTYEKKNALIIPASSLKKGEEGYTVFVVHREEPLEPEEEEGEEEAPSDIMERDLGIAEIRPVTVSYMTQDKVEIEEGLEEGELVIMELYQELQDKQPVEIAEVQEILY